MWSYYFDFLNISFLKVDWAQGARDGNCVCLFCFAPPVEMLQHRWLIFLIREIKKGLSHSFHRPPPGYALASTSYLLHVSNFAPCSCRELMQTLSPFLPALTWNPTPPGLARGVICRSDREASGDWLQRVTARAAPLPPLQSQPLTVVILAWFKGLLHCRQERGPSLLHCALFHAGKLFCYEWCQNSDWQIMEASTNII